MSSWPSLSRSERWSRHAWPEVTQQQRVEPHGLRPPESEGLRASSPQLLGRGREGEGEKGHPGAPRGGAGTAVDWTAATGEENEVTVPEHGLSFSDSAASASSQYHHHRPGGPGSLGTSVTTT